MKDMQILENIPLFNVAFCQFAQETLCKGDSITGVQWLLPVDAKPKDPGDGVEFGVQVLDGEPKKCIALHYKTFRLGGNLNTIQ